MKKYTALILVVLVIFVSCQKAGAETEATNEVSRIEQGKKMKIAEENIEINPILAVAPELIPEIELELKPQVGVINDTRVRLRSEPNLQSETFGFLNTGENLTILDKSVALQQVDGMMDYWYKVQVEGYPEGWVYGAFIDFINFGIMGVVPTISDEFKELLRTQDDLDGIVTQEEISVTEPVPFENIRYFEKIRWRLRYSGFTSSVLNMDFSIPLAQRYYKMKYDPQYEWSKDDRQVHYALLGNDDTSFFRFSKPERKYNYLPIGPLDYSDEKVTDIDNIEGRYIPNSTESDWAYYILTEVTEIEKYIGYVYLPFNESGNHFVSYDPKTATFTSDNTFGEELIEELIEEFEKLYSVDRNRLISSVFPVTPYTNDDFTLQVISYGNNNEKILLKTKQYELGCIPEELLINPGDKCSFFLSFAESIYESPNMGSESISVENVENFEVLERQTKWEEIDGEMSMWYRILTEKGDEGWVWGRDIHLDEAAHSVWY